jgi:hypothetical protein
VPDYTWLLIGDAGVLTPKHPLFASIQSVANTLDTNSSVVYLGDNIYFEGLPSEGASDYAEKRGYLDGQIDAVAGSRGRVFFIPGNHDWAGHKNYGWERVMRQESYVEERLGGLDAFRPTGGCPGPDVVELDARRVMVFLDTHWPMHKGDKPQGDNCPCSATTVDEWLMQINAVLAKYQDRTVLIAGHHNILSNGTSGGRFTWEDHLFPARILHHALYIPLPVIGTGFIGFRMLARHYTDMHHPIYKHWRLALAEMLRQYPNALYTCGHEHSLQLHPVGQTVAITSGAGSKKSSATSGKGALFVNGQMGFAMLRQYADGQLWIEYHARQNDRAADTQVVFRQRIHSGATVGN